MYFKRLLSATLSIIILLTNAQQVLAVYVNGYFRKDGTYVQSHQRTSPDGNPYNNYSFPGNYNPNIGNITGGNADNYLNNYYNNNDYDNRYDDIFNSNYDISTANNYNSSYSSVYNYSSPPPSSYSERSCPYNSYYDSTYETCKCNYGYVADADKCVNASLYCYDLVGLMSNYNSVNKKCECMPGYVFDGNSCVFEKKKTETELCNETYGQNSFSPTRGKCQCSFGYEWNTDMSYCVKGLVCDYNWIRVGNECLSPDGICKSNYGYNSYSTTKSFDKNKNTSCQCLSDFEWSIDKKSCIPIKLKEITPSYKENTADHENISTHSNTKNISSSTNFEIKKEISDIGMFEKIKLLFFSFF